MVDIESLGNSIIGAAIKVHRALGPGLLESAYQICLEYELQKSGFRVDCELSLPIQYESVHIDVGYRIDMLIENMIIIENKTVDHILPIHEAQLLTYLRMRHCRLGYLFNWHVPVMKDGIRRMVNNL
jgi:GxxExxY protein